MASQQPAASRLSGVRRSLTPGRVLGAVLMGTLLLKVLLVLLHGTYYDYQSDDRGYLESARVLLETGRFTYNDPSKPTVFITPAYPGFLASLMLLTGPGELHEQTVRIVQAILVTVSLYLLYRLGRRLVGERAALWGTVLAAFYPPLWLMSNMLFTESLFLLMVLLLLGAAFRAEDRPTAGSAVLFGLLWAAAVYVRPTIALWPGLFFLLLLVRRRIPWRRLAACGAIASLLFVLCLSPWWVRNYQVSGGDFIPLTKSSGNPLLLGTFPWTVPALFMEEQKTWHPTDDLWVNDELDTQMAKERIAEGFREHFFLYLSWYTVGKFLLFWGDVFYWMKLPGVPLPVAVLYHYVLLALGAAGLWRRRRESGTVAVLTLLGYMSLLHMVYLAHSRYSVPLLPLLALYAGAELLRRKQQRNRKKQQGEEQAASLDA
ncbi:hypothetical protein J31TS4_36370 [Paenibacillus sp. J31TS4]|uniref:ArnT family glycosyltransferase n=1 Tax=Paenibacillus sp. J31TS4 TaxID=2807195 RepID=UPI001B2952BA|nr:glycosyltransferase family 39 protein [Paenibacillus sp. J31TS4]GIP40357.1 hypothetical protein J31TS4_36370 [Paenibacillus sp. J31TS4]